MWPAFLIYLAITIPISARLGDAISIPDEATYLFQARLLQSHEVYTTAPPLPLGSGKIFRVDYDVPENSIISGNRWYGMYPPGWPAFLAAWNTALKAPWLANPVLGLLILLLVHLIASATLGTGVADASVWILVASPMFTLNCIGYWSEPLVTALLLGALFFFIKARESNSLTFYVLMSGLAGLALLVRPFESAAFGAALGALSIWRLRKNRHLTACLMAASGVFVAAAIGVILLYNRATTGDLWRFGYAALEKAKLPTEVNFSLSHLLHNLTHGSPLFFATTAEAAFPLLFLLAVYGVIKASTHRAVWILVIVSAVVILAHVAGPETGGGRIGARYYFVPFAVLCILAGLGWTHFRSRLTTGLAANAVRVSAAVFVVSTFVYLTNYGILIRFPYARMAEEIRRIGTRDSVIFVGRTASRYGPAAAINERYINVNGADWATAAALSFPDPGASERTDVCRSVGRIQWHLLRYDEGSDKPAITESGFCSEGN